MCKSELRARPYSSLPSGGSRLMGVYELRYVVEKAMAIMCVETREVTVGGEGRLRWLSWAGAGGGGMVVE